MITLFYNIKDERSLEVRERLRELVIAHRSIEIKKGESSLVDGSRTCKSHREMMDYLDYLEDFKEEWDRFQGDSCYCDKDGKVI